MKKWFLIVFLGSGLLAAQDRKPRDHDQMHRLHSDPKAYIAMLEDPERDAYQKPEEVIRALEIEPGEVIADIGAGSGYFAFRLAAATGVEGRVFAVDISPDMILHMNRRIRDHGVSNVTTMLADPDDPLLPSGSVDRFFICDTWHHIQERPAYLSRIRAALKPGGQLVIIDFHKRELPFGPPMEMKIDRRDLIAEMKESGFEPSREFDFLPYQYFVVFEAK